ncbi:MAG: hypothetical protein ABI472_05115 [Ginsengibacter sp.]
MNINFQQLIPRHFNNNSHVWIYQSSRLFTLRETDIIDELLINFTESWKSNHAPVKGYANLFYGQFIILMADSTETSNNLSTDSFVSVIKNIGRHFGVELFDRLMLAFIIHERIQLLHLSELNSLIEKEVITGDTLYFNNSILTKKEFMTDWIIPVKESWLSSRVLEKNCIEIE